MTQTVDSPKQRAIDEAPSMMPVDFIHANPYQPESRRKFPQDVVEKMAASILEHGLILIPVVRMVGERVEMGDGWLRLAGYRYLAHEKKLQTYAAIPVIVREISDRQMADMVIEANTVRQDLNAIELATLYKRYLDDFGITQTELARKHSCSQGEIANTLRLLQLPDDIRQKVISREIPETHARHLIRLNDNPKTQKKLVERIKDENMPVSRLEQEIDGAIFNATRSIDPGSYYGDRPIFDVETCHGCEHNVKMPDRWDKKKQLDRCNDSKCWDKKQHEASTAASQADIDAINKKGVTDFPDKLPSGAEELDEYELKRIDNPKECATCPKRAGGKRFSGARLSIFCLDKTCRVEKQKVKREADERSQRIEKEKADAHKLDIFSRLDITDRRVLLAMMECFLCAACDDEYATNDFVRINKLGDMSEEDDSDEVLKKIMAGLQRKTSDELIGMLPLLSYAVMSSSYVDGEQKKRLLGQFEAAAKQGAAASEPQIVKIVGKKGDGKTMSLARVYEGNNSQGEPDPLAGLRISIATDSSKSHCIEIPSNGSSEKFQDKSLMVCVTRLGAHLGWGENPEHIQKKLEALPPSANRQDLLGIIERAGGNNGKAG